MKISVTSCVIVLITTMACNRSATLSPEKNIQTLAPVSEAYQVELEEWKKQRFEAITAPKGWLSVVGLHWLKEGENILGSSKECNIVLPNEASPRVGSIFLNNGQLKFKSFSESYVSLGDNNYFPEGEIKSDTDGPPTVLNHGALYFHVIERGGRYGMRVKNTLAQARFDLKFIPHYPANPDMIFKGKVEGALPTDSIVIQNVLGNLKTYPLEAKLSFEYENKQHSFLAINGGEDHYYVIFSDLSTGETTYGGGRFLYVPKPKAGQNTVTIDFNKSENPPCAFTDFATCPLPPDSNKLGIFVKAGEKNTKSH